MHVVDTYYSVLLGSLLLSLPCLDGGSGCVNLASSVQLVFGRLSSG